MKTMNEVFDRYVRDCLPKLAPSTQRQTIGHLKVLRAWCGHRVPTADPLKPRDIIRFLDVDTAKQHRNKIVATLSVVFTNAIGRWCVDGCEVNPCLKVVRHESRPRDRYVTDDEFFAVRALALPSVQIAMDLALLTGQRQGDIVQLRWANVHETYIEIRQGKTGKLLGIKITPAITEVLARARARTPWLLPNIYVIRTKDGSNYTSGGFREAWQLTMEKALKLGAIKSRYTFHDLRAKSASDSASLQDASARLGHSSQALTRRIYDRNIRMVEPLR